MTKEKTETEVKYLKRLPQFVGVLGVLAMLTPLVLAQETHISRQGDGWSQEVTGSLSRGKDFAGEGGCGIGDRQRRIAAGHQLRSSYSFL